MNSLSYMNDFEKPKLRERHADSQTIGTIIALCIHNLFFCSACSFGFALKHFFFFFLSFFLNKMYQVLIEVRSESSDYFDYYNVLMFTV